MQTAHESPDLNMDFRAFDNGLKQLYEWVPMQEYRIRGYLYSKDSFGEVYRWIHHWIFSFMATCESFSDFSH